MTSRLGGRPTKDSKISNGFNQKKQYRKPTRTDKANLKRRLIESKTASHLHRKPTELLTDALTAVTGIDPWADEPTLGAEVPATEDMTGTVDGIQVPDRARPPADPPDVNEEEDDKFSRKLLDDMRWVYKQLRGRTKLKELMENDREYLVMVKELMKIEAAYLTKKLMSKGEGGGSGRQGFFVVLKGLESEKPLLNAIMKNKAIDLRQIERALNPMSEMMGSDSGESRQTEKPAEIIKKAEGVESVEANEAIETVESVEGW